MRRLLYLAALSMLAMMIIASTALAQSRGPSGADGTFNCEDFDFQEDAQAVFNQDTSDPNGLDGPVGPASTGVPNVACENLPSRGGGNQPMMEEQPMMEQTMMMERTQPMPKEMPKTGGPAVGSLLPVSALLLGSGIVTVAVLRRR